MSYFTPLTLKKLNKFIRKDFYESLSQEQIKINESFEYEKQWKNICFPILTPIYTKYQENFQEDQVIPDGSAPGDDTVFEDDVCKLLTENYQLC